ncbi:hypothetical protein B6U74_06955 [Candidatus Bathyarchaeota archaeon ex4484_205]|nr:MAG: hypothetical protein B6U74_06955 [Candidatus Bathyarchaeota archaeon ex4484_205]
MELVALTGLSRFVLEDLIKHKLRAIEIVGFRNLTGAMELREGDNVFLTHIGREEINIGTEGLIAEVIKKEHSMRKFLSHSETDEVEIETVRLRLKYLCRGRISEIERREMIRVKVLYPSLVC